MKIAIFTKAENKDIKQKQPQKSWQVFLRIEVVYLSHFYIFFSIFDVLYNYTA